MRSYRFSNFLVVLVATSLSIASVENARGQIFRSTVGGVTIDANGVLDAASPQLQKTAMEMLREKLDDVPADLKQSNEFRVVSLRGLCDEIKRLAVSSTEELPDELRCLAGLQRIEYLIVVPERKDILLGGPSEAWTLSPSGDFVGVATGQPIVLLDDLLVALQTVESARTVGISCSIDPTQNGRRALNEYLSRQREFRPNMVKEIEQVMGAQEITVTGVPSDSHFARVLVSADYRMKRYAMHLDEAPIKGLPSFLQLMKTGRTRSDNIMPRWWLACDYDSVARTADGLGWQIRGNGVKAMTEDEYISESGEVQGTGKVNPVAQKWADNMTAHYAKLSQTDPVFGQLRNLMDLSIVAALIEREDLCTQAGCDLSRLQGAQLETEKWAVPKTVATHSSFLKQGRNFIVTASGGVQIDSWYFASKTEIEPELSEIVEKASAANSTTWRW